MLNYKYKHELLLLAFVLPSFIGVMFFYVAPFCLSLFYVLVDNSALQNFVGLQNFIKVINAEAFRLALVNTAKFISICIPVNIVIPLCLALLLNKTKKYKNMFALFFLLPLVIPSGSIVNFWTSVFGANGIINGFFFVDTPVNWLDTDFAWIIIILVFIWKNAGYNMVLLMAGISFIPKDYYESASLEGAGAFRKFFSITLVYLTPTLFLVFIMSIINSFKSFREIYLLAGAYPHNSIYMLQHYMNNQFAALNYQKLASASYILSAFIIAAVLTLFKFQNHISKNM